MQDLSNLFEQMGSDPITALVPTSQAGGNMMSSAKLALTAPGSPPSDPLPPASEQGNPKITAITHKPSVLDPDADGPAAGAPYPKTPGPRWVRATDVKTEGLNDYG